MRSLAAACALAVLAGSAHAFPFADWDALLHRYTDDRGRVDYVALKANAGDRQKLEHLVTAVAVQSPERYYPTRDAKLAFYIDAYNVIIWHLVLERIPGLKTLAPITDELFKKTEIMVGGKKTTLSDFENQIIRAQFKDPRVHMALNCASAGCPILPREAFVPERLQAQLDAAARRFVAETRNVALGPGNRLRLSKLFDWYKDDFGGETSKVIRWINGYRERALPLDAQVEYVEYDWTLNDPSLRR